MACIWMLISAIWGCSPEIDCIGVLSARTRLLLLHILLVFCDILGDLEKLSGAFRIKNCGTLTILTYNSLESVLVLRGLILEI